jgi:pimeloyl-ACP methyl ester carboxylesterase
VVLVPGLGLDGRAWTPVTKRLPGASRTILLPSLGQRAPRGTDLRVEAQADRLLGHLAADADSGVVLVGHSASCPVVAETALRSRDITGLVLIGPVTDPRARTWPRMLAQWARTATHEHLRELPVLLPQYRRTGPVTMARGMDAVRGYRTDITLAMHDIPVAVVRGGRDRIARADWSSRLADVTGGRVTTVDGAAHMLPLTHPDAVVRTVNDIVSAAHRSRVGSVT